MCSWVRIAHWKLEGDGSAGCGMDGRGRVRVLNYELVGGCERARTVWFEVEEKNRASLPEIRLEHVPGAL
jgi:Lon protease-like protein